MIYTITFNPAIDYVIGLNNLNLNAINRTTSEKIFFGGKGINVSYVLNTLGVPNVALGFVAGFTGKAIEEGVKSLGIQTDFIHLKEGFSRINVKIKSNEETEINGQGANISKEELEELYTKLDTLKLGDFLVLAGSVPNSLPSDVYENILRRLYKSGVNFVVDATNQLMLNSLKYEPFLIKPNHIELAEMFNVELHSNDDIITYARKLKKMGAVNVLVSMAERGSILVDANDNVHITQAPQGIVVNSVGAGDSMLGGFLASYSVNHSYDEALKLGTACGSATTFSEGLAEKADIDDIYNSLT
jgi:1-phosphofructokinase